MLTERQTQIVTGSLLGDGTIWTNFVDPMMKLQIGQSKRDHQGDDKSSYICWYVKEFLSFGCSVRPMTIKATGIVANGKKSHFDRYVFCSRCDKIWNQIESKWYVPRTDHHRFKRRKIVPTDIKLTPLTLCIWHMDDGSNNQKDANIELNTQSFTVDEVDFLINRLKEDIGINSHKKTGGRKEGQYKIYIGRNSYFDFIDMIKPHIEWDCFKYKTETIGYTKQPHRGEDHSGSILTEDKVHEIFRMRDEGMLQKEIAEKIGTSNISAVLSGEQWGHLGLSRPKLKKPRVTKDKKRQVVDMNSQGVSQKNIAETLNINQSTVSRLVNQSNLRK